MSILYKSENEQTFKVEIKQETIKDDVELLFWSDCGKFGTDEILDAYKLTPKRLLQILQERNDIKDAECDF